MTTRKSRTIEGKNQAGRVLALFMLSCLIFSCSKKNDAPPAIKMIETALPAPAPVSAPASVPVTVPATPPAPQAMIPAESGPDKPIETASAEAVRTIVPQKFVDPASSLAQADRHLTARPLEIHTASDFVLGPLFSAAGESANLAAATNALCDALRDKKLPLEFLSEAAGEVLPVLLGSTLEKSPDIGEIRVAAVQQTPDGNSSIKFSVFTATGRAEGLAILSQTDSGPKIEHISLDSEALFLPYAPLKDFDPYGLLVSPR